MIKLIGSIGLTTAVVIAAYFFYDHEGRESRRIIAELERKLDRAWSAELVADIVVHSVDGGKIDATFVQYSNNNEVPAFERRLTLHGEEIYIDALVAQFDRGLVEANDGLRGKSILLFRKAFGDRQEPANGIALFCATDDSLIPAVAAVDSEPSEFERKLWSRFWDIANSPALSTQLGVRVAQGEAPHVKAVAGQVYKLTLRAAGGLEITPRLPAAVVGSGR